MQSTVILPIISLLALVVGGIFHININEGEQKVIAESVALLVTSGIALYGIIKNHRTPK